MPYSQIPTFALNKLVKIRYFLVLAQNLSLEMRYSKTFKNDYFLHLMTQLLGIHNFFPKSYQVDQKLKIVISNVFANFVTIFSYLAVIITFGNFKKKLENFEWHNLLTMMSKVNIRQSTADF